VIDDLASFRAFVRADYSNMGVALSVRTLLFDPVARFVLLKRWDEYLLNTNKPVVLRRAFQLWLRRLSVRLGFSLGPNIFGPGVAIVHYGLLVIDPTTRIGKNCRIHMGAHIGGSAQFVPAEDQHKYSPRIGDNVYIGPGAKLYGPIRIGNNCTIGANSVVTKSFESDGLTLAGIPAKVIGEGGDGNRVLQSA